MDRKWEFSIPRENWTSSILFIRILLREDVTTLQSTLTFLQGGGGAKYLSICTCLSSSPPIRFIRTSPLFFETSLLGKLPEDPTSCVEGESISGSCSIRKEEASPISPPVCLPPGGREKIVPRAETCVCVRPFIGSYFFIPRANTNFLGK